MKVFNESDYDTLLNCKEILVIHQSWDNYGYFSEKEKDREREAILKILNIPSTISILCTTKDNNAFYIENVYKIYKNGLKISFEYYLHEKYYKTLYNGLDADVPTKSSKQVITVGSYMSPRYFKKFEIIDVHELYATSNHKRRIGFNSVENSIRNIKEVYITDMKYKYHDLIVVDRDKSVGDRLHAMIDSKKYIKINNKKHLQYPFGEKNPYGLIYDLKFNLFES